MKQNQKNVKITNNTLQQNQIIQIQIYQSIKEIGKILGKEHTTNILYHLSIEPMRYSQIKNLLKCKDNTLSRRLNELIKYDIIKKLPVSFGIRMGNEYTITELGQEIIRFFRRFERTKNNKELEKGR